MLKSDQNQRDVEFDAGDWTSAAGLSDAADDVADSDTADVVAVSETAAVAMAAKWPTSLDGGAVSDAFAVAGADDWLQLDYGLQATMVRKTVSEN